MMVRHDRTFIVGAFVAGTAVILAILLLWLAGSRFLRPVDRYRVLFKGSVSGLLPGAAVELNGVAVGKVSAIHLTRESPPRVEVDLEVEPGTPVMQDSVATLSGSLVTGIRFIQVSGGTGKAGPLGQDEAIAADEGSFDDIRRQASELTQQTRSILSTLDQDILNRQNRAALGQMIQDFGAAAHNLRVLTDDLSASARVQTINSTLENLNRASERLSHAADRAGATIETFSSHREELYGELSSALKQLNTTLAGAQRAFTSTDGLITRNSADLEQTLRQLNHTSRHLDEAIDTIQADPSVLLWGSKVPERELRQ